MERVRINSVRYTCRNDDFLSASPSNTAELVANGAHFCGAVELFGQFERKMLQQMETRMSGLSTEMSRIHHLLAVQQGDSASTGHVVQLNSSVTGSRDDDESLMPQERRP